jgi:hypothetical protein
MGTESKRSRLAARTEALRLVVRMEVLRLAARTEALGLVARTEELRLAARTKALWLVARTEALRLVAHLRGLRWRHLRLRRASPSAPTMGESRGLGLRWGMGIEEGEGQPV